MPFIAKDSVYYALQTIERFFERVQVLSEYPEMGRVVPEFSDYSIRELIEGITVLFTKYIRHHFYSPCAPRSQRYRKQTDFLGFTSPYIWVTEANG